MFAISSFLWILVYSVILYRVGISLIDLNGFSGVLKKKSFKALASKGMGYMMSPVWQGIYFQGTTFVVRVLLGAESVAIFNTIRTVCSSVKSLFGIIAESIFPEMQYEYGKGNIPIVQRLFRCSVLIAMLWGVLGTLGLILFGSQIYGVWTRNAFSVQSSVWNVFMFSVLLTSLWRTGTIVYRITNQPKHLAIVTLVAAVFSTLLSYLLARRFELIGVVVGSVFLDVILASTILPKACKLLNMQMRDLFVHVNKDVGLIKYYVKKPLKKILR